MGPRYDYLGPRDDPWVRLFDAYHRGKFDFEVRKLHGVKSCVSWYKQSFHTLSNSGVMIILSPERSHRVAAPPLAALPRPGVYAVMKYRAES